MQYYAGESINVLFSLRHYVCCSRLGMLCCWISACITLSVSAPFCFSFFLIRHHCLTVSFFSKSFFPPPSSSVFQPPFVSPSFDILLFLLASPAYVSLLCLSVTLILSLSTLSLLHRFILPSLTFLFPHSTPSHPSLSHHVYSLWHAYVSSWLWNQLPLHYIGYIWPHDATAAGGKIPVLSSPNLMLYVVCNFASIYGEVLVVSLIRDANM